MATAVQNEQKRARFIEHFRKRGNVSWACRVSGLARTTLYDWLKEEFDEPGAAAFRDAYRQAEVEATEYLEEQAWKRAIGFQAVRVKHEVLRTMDGEPIIDPETRKPKVVETERTITQEYNPTILMRLLAARAPDKYRERIDNQHSGPGGGPIPLALVDDIVAKAEAKDNEGEAA